VDPAYNHWLGRTLLRRTNRYLGQASTRETSLPSPYVVMIMFWEESDILSCEETCRDDGMWTFDKVEYDDKVNSSLDSCEEPRDTSRISAFWAE